MHKRNITLRDLSEQSRQKVLDTVVAIYQQFELSSNPQVSIGWVPASETRNHEARRLAPEFLENEDVVTHHKFHYEDGGVIDVEIDVKEFFRVRDELLNFYQDACRTLELSKRLFPLFLESSYEEKASILKLLASNYIIAEGPSRLTGSPTRTRFVLGHPRRKKAWIASLSLLPEICE
jgi:hypothetical protein